MIVEGGNPDWGCASLTFFGLAAALRALAEKNKCLARCNKSARDALDAALAAVAWATDGYPVTVYLWLTDKVQVAIAACRGVGRA